MADTIRVLVATDNHVGYAERDPVRGDDSWKTFHEIMCLAKERDVDMVLLAGDLFHENKPSRKSMYNVMRSLRLNCYGDKPCELELLSDGSEHFDSTIGHANYEDPDINVAIPVFSIHGNHDDPSGEGHFAALDILEMAGLINYFGRVPESDNIVVRPLFFQKGRTKLALFGMSNVRDERLHREFRDNKVKFLRPGTQQNDWFNLMAVHQNHHAHTETSYLPEEQLPDYMDLIIWGHEHECDIAAHRNPEKGFKVIQPGSSVATSLVPGEAAPKHVMILNITGRDFKQENIRLKTVRPFVYKDIILSQEKEVLRIAKKNDHRTELTRYLEKIVRGLIKQAKEEWIESQGEDFDPESSDSPSLPLPIIRLRVETTSPDGGATKFDIENPQRFSNRFINEVANRNDVVQFFARKRSAGARNGAGANNAIDAEILAKFQDLDVIDVDKLVKEVLASQSLTILPQNYFGEAVSQFIDKDDRHAMEMFVNESLANQIKHLVALHRGEDDGDSDDEDDEDNLARQIEKYRGQLEEMFKQGKLKSKLSGPKRYKPKPDGWDSDWDGHWEDQPGALLREDEDNNHDNDDNDDDDNEITPAPRTTARGRGARGRGSRAGATTATTTRGRGTTRASRAAPSTRTTATTSSRARKAPVAEDSDEDIIMQDTPNNNNDRDQSSSPEEDGDSQAIFVPEKKTKPSVSTRANATTAAAAAATSNGTAKNANKTTTAAPKSVRKTPARAATRGKQSTLNFTASQASILGGGASQDVEDEDDDDDDAFEPVKSSSATRSRRKF